MAGDLPDFLVIGAQKAGSTWLTRNLRQHPEIFMPQKELRFFTKEYPRGVDWYSEHFAGASVSQIIGEGTPDYLFRKGCSERIHTTLRSDVKLIASLREPGERAYSAFWNLLGGEQLPRDADFLEAFEQDINGLRTRGHYAEQLIPYFDHFGRDAILVTIMERDLGPTGPRTMASIYDFLRVDRSFVPASSRSRANVGDSPRRGGARIGKMAVAASNRLDRVPPRLTGVVRTGYRRAFARLPVAREKVPMTLVQRAALDAYYQSHVSHLEDLLSQRIWTD